MNEMFGVSEGVKCCGQLVGGEGVGRVAWGGGRAHLVVLHGVSGRGLQRR